MGKRADLTGKVFDRLTVIKFGGHDKKRVCTWDCVCKCGNTHNVRADNLVSGRTTSCGCKRIIKPKMPVAVAKRLKRKRTKRNYDLTREFLSRYKKLLSCSHCGISFRDHPEICDFHHINPQDKNHGVSQMIQYGINIIKIEIRKCLPLCANCHRIEHSR